MSTNVLGIHHVTAIAADPQRNLDFYAGVLGLRLVKRTVNFDDPGAYHFYYGDAAGTPGSIMTFFPWPGARRGRAGAGQAAVTRFAVLPRALGFWVERFVRRGVAFDAPARRAVGADAAGAEQVLAFRDPDGMLLELVAHPGAEARAGWEHAPGVAADQAIRGFHSVALWVGDGEPTERVLTDALGFRAVAEWDGGRRYAAGDGGVGTLVDVRPVGGFARALGGAGTVHHVAWRVADDAAELRVRERARSAGLDPTPTIDRQYFRSVYFREPGGVLFELATDGPGFAVDETPERLGAALQLPPQYEPDRARIERALPPVVVPGAAGEAPDDLPAAPALSLVHRHVRPDAVSAAAGTTLLLLHGTGGDEDDLVPLGQALLPGAALLSPRGAVLERGMPRFFRRVAEGVFDQEDLRARTGQLGDFVDAAAATYGFDRGGVVAAGFSNGANIAASLLLRRPGSLRAAILLSPMVPFEPDAVPNLAGTAVFIGAGRADPIVPVTQVERLAAILREAGADVKVHWEAGGHAITEGEVEAARAWLAEVVALARR